MSNPVGRPPKFKTVEEFDELLELYFKREQYYTITGVCLHLGFCDKHTFYEYGKKPEFSHSVKRARMMVENSYENHLHKQTNSGAIFALKNFGWTDRPEETKEDKPLRVQIERISKD